MVSYTCSGGDIPSRSRLTITNDQFHQLFPDEFWSEVMTRIEKEAPNTLLIAEAFWMMESYFVRTLGVHRVYNSAFMHMIRDQKNKEYRQIIKSTLEYDPRILHRYVNFYLIQMKHQHHNNLEKAINILDQPY